MPRESHMAVISAQFLSNFSPDVVRPLDAVFSALLNVLDNADDSFINTAC